ncbi:hypothetical protein Q4F19_14165 [Sphingomonas sp. BIUV-7]|uniref:Autotransporter domain-containing protein n=1 Tax=Sphingomonas natans TaxID=3063330 RepID=A0ABT8YB18_9SPHN|nr:hypothetical protein [Sphingomonas sp. BIUV-7]MDO6415532.1 hypothetical protein [Sphingomonas sp. BIUV-7]
MRSTDPKTPAKLGTRRRKLELYATAAIGGLSVFFMETPPSWAQAINATGIGRYNLAQNTTSATVTLNSGNATNIQVNTSQAIIDWNIPGGAGDYQFLNANTTATFYNSSGAYTVLNVLNGGTRAMRFDGAVVARTGGVTGAIGGNVWFYSPGGILVGSGASFNVGSLLLTTLNPDPNNLPGQNFSSFNDGTNGNTIGLRTDTNIFPTNNTSQIQIAAGATLTAQNYIGIVAPRIVQGGTIAPKGALGLIAGEQVNLDISSDGGLFGISIPVGSNFAGDADDSANVAILQSGTISGTFSGNGAPTKRNIYMVAVPKNTAITMLLTAQMGYGFESSNAVVTAQGIVLLAGTGVGTAINTAAPDGLGYTSPIDSVKTGQIRISGGSDFRSRVTTAGTRTEAFAQTGNINFRLPSTLYGTQVASLDIASGQTVTTVGMGVRSGITRADGSFDALGSSATVTVAGTLRIDPNGILSIDASSTGVIALDGVTNSGVGGSVTGGTTTLTINDGTIEGTTPGTTGGLITLLADASGGGGTSGGGTAVGGAANVTINGGTFDGTGLSLSARAIGGDDETVAAGLATGGTVSVTLQAGATQPRLHTTGDLALTATATGGSAYCGFNCHDGSGLLIGAPGTPAGNAVGGTATVTMGAVGGAIQVVNLNLDVSAIGGGGGLAIGTGPDGYYNAAPGGQGSGGTAKIVQSGGDITALGIALTAEGRGGLGGDASFDDYGQFDQTGNAGNGGIGQGGILEVRLSNAARIIGQSGSTLSLSGFGLGGGGGTAAYEGAFMGVGGIGRGPLAGNPVRITLADTASITRDTVTLTGAGYGGNGRDHSDATAGDGGAAFGNDVIVEATSAGGAQFIATTLELDSSAQGGTGGFGSNISTGGNATGGTSTIAFTGAALTTTTTQIYATGQGGAGGSPSSSGAQGISVSGDAVITATNALLALGTANIYTYANGNGFDGEYGTNGFAGDITISTLSGAGINAGSGFNLQAYAYGGAGSLGAGTGYGGSISLVANSGNITANGSSTFDTRGYGGNQPNGVAGFGFGGAQSIQAVGGGTVNLAATQIEASGTGGDGVTGGNGLGGAVTLLADNGTFNATSTLQINSSGFVGSSQSGIAQGTGGAVIVRANAGSFTFADTLGIDTTANSNGAGGDITIEAIGSGPLSQDSVILGATDLDASAGFSPGAGAGAGTITIRNMSSTALNFADVTANALGSSADAPRIVLESGSNRINGSRIELNTDAGLTVTAVTPGGGIYASGNFITSAAGSTIISGYGVDPTIQAANIDIEYYDLTSSSSFLNAIGADSDTGYISVRGYGAMQLGQLRATNGIELIAGTDITVDGAFVTAPAVFDGSGNLDTSIGYFRAEAGSYEGNLGSITSNGAVTVLSASASSRVSLYARGNITVAGQVDSQNLIDISVGNDLVVTQNAQINANTAPLSASTGGISFQIGNGYGDPGDPSSFISSGSINANGTPLAIYADAIQAKTGTFAGSSVTFGLNGNAVSGDDGGQLTADCTAGSLCLGNINATESILVDSSNSIPTTVTLAGTISGADLTVIAGGVILGNNGVVNDMLLSSYASLDVDTGAITGAIGGSGTLTASDIYIRASSVSATNFGFATSSGDFAANVTGGIEVGTLDIAGRLGSRPDGFANGLNLAGPFAAINRLSVGSDTIDITAAGITIGQMIGSGDARLAAPGNTIIVNDVLVPGVVSASGTLINLGSSGNLAIDDLTGGSGGTTLLAAGTLSLTNVTSTGPLIVTGSSVDANVGTLTFTQLNTTAGDANVTGTGNLVVNGGNAIGSVFFSGSGVTATNYSATQDITLAGTTIGNFSSLTGRNISITAQSGSFGGTALNASGTTFLSAPINVSVSALNSTGGVTANARGLQLIAPAAMTVTSATAGTGGMTLSAGGQLIVASATSGADIVLESANAGIAAQTTSSTTGTAIRAPGAVTVASLTSGGNVSAQAGSLQIVSPGALTFSRAIATNGGISVTTQGALTVLAGTQSIPNPSATGDSSFVASGILTLPTFTTPGNLSLQGNFIGTFTALSGANVSLVAQSGSIGGQTLTASGTTFLSAPTNVSVSALNSAGGVTVNARGVSLFAPGALTVTSAIAGPGGMTLSAGGQLTVASATSAADIVLETTNGGITAQTISSTTGTGIRAPGAVTIASLTSTGNVGVQAGSIQIASPGALTLSRAIATNGGINVTTQGALTVLPGQQQIPNPSATGDSSFIAGGQLTLTTFATPGNLTLQGNGIAAFNTLSGANVSLVAASGAISGPSLTATGTTFLSTPGAINISALRSSGAVTASGSRITLVSPDALTIANFTTAQGDASFQSANLLTVADGTSAGALAMTSTGAGLTVGTVNAAGAVTGNAAGAIGFGQISGDTVSLSTSAGGITGQRLAATGAATLSAPGAIAVSGDFRAASASVSGSSVAIASTSDLTFATLSATSGDAVVTTSGALTVNGGSAAGAANLASGGTLTLASYTSGTDLVLSGARLPTFGTLSARNISLTALASDLTGGTLIASGTTTLSSSGVLTITDLRSAGAATLSGATINVGSTVALNVANATAGDGGLRLRSTGALTVTNATSQAGVDLASTGGNVTVGRIAMTGTPAITTQAVAGTSPLTIASAGTTTLTDAITGAGAATISGTSLVLNGLIDASGISLASQTIAVGPAALIGTLQRTGTVAFTNSGTGRSFIGGTGSQSGYSLDGAALSRVQASSVSLTLPRTATSSVANPDVVIGALTLYGTGAAAPQGARQNLGTGLLTITTPGQVQVNGAVRLANLATGGSGGLTVRAAGIDVVAPNGSIVQTDAAGTPAGTLELDGRSVRVASSSALADLATLATPTEREARLAQNDGNMSDTGWLSANTIRFAYPSGVAATGGIAAIYVQNSGGSGSAARRGLTTGTGGVVIANFPTSDIPEVFINGRLQTTPTTFVTGSAFLASISQVGTGTASDILVNGCVLSSGLCGGAPTPLTLLSQLAPPQDLIGVISNSTEDDEDEDTNKPGDPVPSKDPQAIVQFAPANPEAASQSTDDPVIGSGNESLWTGGGAGAGEAGGVTPFDTTIGVGNDAGAPDNGQPRTTGGATGGTGAPQQPGERATGVNPATEGGLGIGSDAAAGGEQRSGAGGTSGNAGAAGAINTPNTPATPGSVPNNGGGVGVGADTGGGAPGAAGSGNAGTALPGAAQGTTGGSTTGDTTNGRPNTGNGAGANAGQGAPTTEQTTGTGGDAGASGSAGTAGTPGGAAGTTGPSAPGTTNNGTRQTTPNTPR